MMIRRYPREDDEELARPLASRRRALAVVISIWVVARLTLIWTGWPEARLIADDAYYYFTIAHNIADGMGPTFDGLAPTNGFHPLWQLMLVPVFGAFDGADLWTPVRVALTLSSVFDLISGWLIYQSLCYLANQRRAVVGLIIWLASPLSFVVALRGMEASLSSCCLLLVFWLVVRFHRTGKLEHLRSAVGIGLALGLCGLARTDNLATVGLALAFTFGLKPNVGSAHWVRLRWLAVVAGTAAAVTAPWFAWNLARFGALVQVSGQVKYVAGPALYGALPWAWSDLPEAATTVTHMLLSPIMSPVILVTGGEFGDHSWAIALTWTSAILGIGATCAGWRRMTGDKRTVLVLGGAYVLLHSLLFGVIWRAYANWYALPSLAIFAVFVAGLGEWPRSLSEVRRIPAASAVGLTTLALLFWMVIPSSIPHEPKGPQTRFMPLLEQAAGAMPDGVVLGAFDAGAIGYLATDDPRITVTNLDCLVNNEAFDALRSGRYVEYVIETVDFLLQDPGKARMFLPDHRIEILRQHYRLPVVSP